MNDIDLRHLGNFCGQPLYLDVSDLHTEEERLRKVLTVRALLTQDMPKVGVYKVLKGKHKVRKFEEG